MAASLIAGLAGFAFGLVAAALWLHVLTPLQTTTLIVAFGLVVQGLSVWRLRRALRFDRLWPFLAGGAVGVPIGAELLRWADPQQIRVGVGVLLILFSLYSLFRPKLAVPMAGGRAAGNRTRLQAAAVRVKVQPTRSLPRCRALRTPPQVFIQPNASSMRLRIRWLTA